MLRKQIEHFYLEGDFNCAEATLHALNAEYNLGLAPEDFKLLSGFGGGMGCGHVCGALCGAMAALGRLAVEERAHLTEGFKDLCSEYVKTFEDALGGTMCEVLSAKYRTEETRCLETVLLAADVFERFYQKNSGQFKCDKL